MKITRFKPFWSVEKEQNWINQMSANGYALTDYFWIRYVFEKTEPGEYAYQIDLLEKNINTPETDAYIKFLEESDIEVVSTYMRWIYLRKKTSNGPFQLYTDNESRLKYLHRRRNFWLGLIVLEFWAAFVNAVPAISSMLEDDFFPDYFYRINVFFAVLCFCIGICMFIGCLYPIRTQIKKIRKEQNLFE